MDLALFISKFTAKLPGFWIIENRTDTSVVAHRMDGLEFQFAVSPDFVAAIEYLPPSSPSRPQNPTGWDDVSNDGFPKPMHLNLAEDKFERSAARFASTMLVEAEAFTKFAKQVIEIESRSPVPTLVEAIKTSGFARGINHDDGYPPSFRLYSPFAGNVVIRDAGKVSLRLQDVDPAVAVRLFEAMREICDTMIEPASLPRFEKPTVPDRRGNLLAWRGSSQPSGTNSTREAILDALAVDPSVKQTELAKRLGMTRQAVSSHIKRLREEGLLETPSSDVALQTPQVTD